MSGEYLCTGIIAKELKQEHLLIDIEQTNVLEDALREAAKKKFSVFKHNPHFSGRGPKFSVQVKVLATIRICSATVQVFWPRSKYEEGGEGGKLHLN